MAKKKAAKSATSKRTSTKAAKSRTKEGMPVWNRGKPRRPSRVALAWQDRAAAKCISRDGNVEYTIVETPENDAHLVVDCGLLSSIEGAKLVAGIIARVLQNPDGLCRDLENLDPRILQSFDVDEEDSLIITVTDIDDEIAGDEGGYLQPG